MSLSNPIYGTLPAFQRPGSTGPGTSGGGGMFMPPPPGASQGGEPGHYPFQRSYSHPSPHNPHQSQLLPQAPWAYPTSQQSQSQNRQQQDSQQAYLQSQQSQNHSLFHAQPSPQTQHQAVYPQSNRPSASWTYAQYPPSPDFPVSATGTSSGLHILNTPSGASRYSPYGVQTTHPPPASAPAEVAPWSQQSHSHQSQRRNSQQHSNFDQHQQQQNARGQRQHHQSNSSPGHVPFSDEAVQHPTPRPFRGSANAPAPKKSAMRRSNSHSAATDRPSTSGIPYTPQMLHIHHNTSTGSATGVNGAALPFGPVMPSIPSPNVPGYTLPDQAKWDGQNLSPRPRDWRADYSPKQGLSSYLPKINKARTDVEEYMDTVKRMMHPLILQSSGSGCISFDLRYGIFSQPKSFNEVDLAQLATSPHAPMLRLYHPKLPWYVDIHQSHSTGVTVFDVLVQLSLQMQVPIRQRHYYNEVLDSTDRTELANSYKERTRGRPGEKGRGIFQVDFVKEKYVFEGLVRGKQGLWEIKTRRPVEDDFSV